MQSRAHLLIGHGSLQVEPVADPFRQGVAFVVAR